VQNLGGGFVVFFFLGGQNRNFEKVRELKLLLSEIKNRRRDILFYFDLLKIRKFIPDPY